MSKKATSKKQVKKLSWGKYAVRTALALIILVPLVYIAFQYYLDSTNANDFSTMKSDLLTLQKKLNKVNQNGNMTRVA